MKTRKLVNYSTKQSLCSLRADETTDVSEMRTANSKSYRNSNGSYTAIIFGEPIHYLDRESNSYKEIDNSLELCDNGKYLQNKHNRFSVKLASIFSGDFLLINQDDYEIRVSSSVVSGVKINKNSPSAQANLNYRIHSRISNLLEQEKSPPTKASNAKSLADRRVQAMEMTLESDVAYENVQDGIDLRYGITPRKVKEDIIINRTQDKYEYVFNFKIKNLTVKLAENGSINFHSKVNDSIIFTIPSPFMYDDNGQVSTSVFYDIDSSKKNECIIKIKADASWINDKTRAFPVIIDPQIISNDFSSINIESYSNGELIPSSDHKNALGMCFGKLYDLKVNVTAPNYLDAFDNQTRILNATIELTKVEDKRTNPNTKGFEASVTYNDTKRVIDRFIYNGSNDKVDINITGEMNDALLRRDSKVIVDISRVTPVENPDANDYIIFSNSNDPNAENRPKILIDYISERVNMGDGSYYSVDNNRSGTAKINLCSGALVFTHTDVSNESSIVPMQIKHIYNSALKGRETDFVNTSRGTTTLTPNFHMGKGWKLNIQQYLIKNQGSKLYSGELEKILYIDGNGDHQYFEEKYYYLKNGVKYYIDFKDVLYTADNEMYIIINENGQEIKYTVYNGHFTESGLTLMVDPQRLLLVDDSNYESKYYINYQGKTYIDYDPITRIYSFSRRYNPYIHEYNHQVFVNDQIRFYTATGSREEVTECKAIKKNGKTYIRFYTHNIAMNSGYWGTSYQQVFSEYEVIQERIYSDNETKIEDEFTNSDIVTLKSDIANLKKYKEDIERNINSYNSLLYEIQNPESITNQLKRAREYYQEYYGQINSFTLNCNEQSLYRQSDYLAKSKELDEINDTVTQLQLNNIQTEIENAKKSKPSSAKWYKPSTWFRSSEINAQRDAIDKKVIYYTELHDNQQAAFEKQVELRDFNYEFQESSIEDELELISMNRALKEYEDQTKNLQEALEAQDLDEREETLKYELNKYNNELDNVTQAIAIKEYELEALILDEKKKPVDYIVDSAGNMLAFDYYGKLVNYISSNGNIAQIKYNENDDIVQIDVEDSPTLYFEYYYDRLNKIIDRRGRTTLYEYDLNGYLKKIVYSDNQKFTIDGTYDNRITEFVYNRYEEIDEVIDQSGKSLKFMYDVYKRVEYVEQRAYAEEIQNNHIIWNKSAQKGDNVHIRYNDYKSTSLIDNHNNIVTHVFDNAGRAVTIYSDEQNIGDNFKIDSKKLQIGNAVSLCYSGKRKSYSVSLNTSAENFIKNGDFTDNLSNWTLSGSNISLTSECFTNDSYALKFVGDAMTPLTASQKIYAKDLPKTRNLILSCWAKAESAFVQSDRVTGYGEDIFENNNIESSDEMKRNRRFGIAAAIKYVGYEEEIMQTTFDWYSTVWQFAALPIRLLKDRQLEYIRVILDYSNNINIAYFDAVKLIQGIGDYKEFYDDGQVRYSTNGMQDIFYPEYRNGMPTHTIIRALDGREFLTEYTYDVSNKLIRMKDSYGQITEYDYDINGKLLRSSNYHESDPTNRKYYEYENNNQGELIKEIDPRGFVDGKEICTQYDYYTYSSLVKEITLPNGGRKVYGYDNNNDNLLSLTESTDGQESTNTFNYTKGYLTEVTDLWGCTIDYSFDGFGRNISINLNGCKYISSKYDNNFNIVDDELDKNEIGEQVVTTYCNGDREELIFDKFNRNIISKYYPAGSSVTSEYIKNKFDNMGNVIWSKDGLTGIITENKYDVEGYLISSTRSDGMSAVFTINPEIGKVTQETFTVSSEETVDKHQYEYEYDNDINSRLLSIAFCEENLHSSISYDLLGRKQAIAIKQNERTLLSTNINYLKYGEHTTDFAAGVRYSLNGTFHESERYGYDDCGNIKSITENGRLIKRYSYDKLNRLIREDNRQINRTYIYEYDKAGNITSYMESPFSLENIIDGNVVLYNYDLKSKNVLLSYNGEKCECDENGIVTMYRGNEIAYSRFGLVSNYGENVSFYYASNGERVKKIVNGIETIYVYTGEQIFREIRENKELDYFYDISGIKMIKINNEYYILRKNILGDITHIYKLINNNLELSAKYVYDAWGNHIVLNPDGTENTNSEFIGNINPFRYRGYYFDAETKLYYLGTRYYDPQSRRFISGDNIKLINPTNINGLNIYSYCLNNPVMMIDKTGNIPFANYFNQIQVSNEYGWNSFFWGRITYTTTKTISRSDEETGFLYAFTSTNNTSVTAGFGINFGDWFGIEFGFGGDEIGFSVGMNITPWFNLGVSVGLNGVTLSFGFVDSNGVSHDFSIGIGLGPLLLIGNVILSFLSGGTVPLIGF